MRVRTVALRIAAGAAVLAGAALGALYWIGAGGPGERWEEGTPVPAPLAQETTDLRDARRAAAAPRDAGAKQILFGDLHVHSTFSLDAFAMALPLVGGAGARPISDACDFARFCSGLDFWSINDHAIGLTPWKWQQTVEAIRQCDAVAGETDDVTPFLGWEWTQVGLTPERHYGHKNVVLRGLSDDEIPDRPIAAKADRALASTGRIFGGLLGAMMPRQDIFDLVRAFDESGQFPDCPAGVPVRGQAPGCRDIVATPAELFTRLDDWGFPSIVIPHGTTWGAYTPPGSSWEKQLVGGMHDPARQTLIEIFSGHGNSEEHRAWRAVERDAQGRPACPEPSEGHLSGCWRAGKLVQERCVAAGESAEECARRATEARRHFVEAGLPGHLTVPGATPREWLDADQCRDCFQPAFRYRPGSSAQAILAIRDFAEQDAPRRFAMGFIASSDNHTARPGTGYKEFGRVEMTDARIMHLGRVLDPAAPATERSPRSVPYEPTPRPLSPAEADAERGASFFGTGGLVGMHADGRGREAIWRAFERKEVYGTSGPQILLWFDLLNPPGADGKTLPMGSETAMSRTPAFRVRAVGSFAQRPGCPSESLAALGGRAPRARVRGGVPPPERRPPRDHAHRGRPHPTAEPARRAARRAHRGPVARDPVRRRARRLQRTLRRRRVRGGRARHPLLRPRDRGTEPCHRRRRPRL